MPSTTFIASSLVHPPWCGWHIHAMGQRVNGTLSNLQKTFSICIVEQRYRYILSGCGILFFSSCYPYPFPYYVIIQEQGDSRYRNIVQDCHRIPRPPAWLPLLNIPLIQGSLQNFMKNLKLSRIYVLKVYGDMPLLKRLRYSVDMDLSHIKNHPDNRPSLCLSYAEHFFGKFGRVP